MTKSVKTIRKGKETKMEQKLTLHIVPHTHWDREWYFTVEEFRYRLVKLIDILLRCMEEESITYFVLEKLVAAEKGK